MEERTGIDKGIGIGIVLFAATAAFLFIFRTGTALKPFDVLMALIGILLLFDATARRTLKSAWPSFAPYVRYFFFMILFVVVGQMMGALNYEKPVYYEVVTNYGRVIFNSYLFFLTAFLIYHRQKLARIMSTAIFLSPIVVLPAYSPKFPLLFESAGRLAGFQQSPVSFGMWMVLAFFIGIALFLDLKNKITRGAIVLWLCVIANFILWSGTRAGWLAFVFLALSASLFFVTRKNFRKAASILTVVFVTVSAGYFLLDYVPKTLWGIERIKPWVAARAVKLVTRPFKNEERPVWFINTSRFAIINPLGIGVGFVRDEDYAANKILSLDNGYVPGGANSFLEITLYGGIGALLAFLAILARLGKDIKCAVKSLNSAQGLQLVLILSAPAMILDIFFAGGFLYRSVWFVLGIALGTALTIAPRRIASTIKA